MLLEVQEPPDEEVPEVAEDMPVQLLESPFLSGPDHSRQVELLIALEAVDDDFDPIGADAHVRVSLGDLFDGWKLRFEIRSVRHLEEEHDSAPLIPRELLDGLLAVEDVLHGVVLHPADQEARGRVAVLLLHHLSKIIKVMLIVDSEPHFVVLVVSILLILQEVALNVLVLGVWNRQRNHEVGIERD